MVKPILLLIGIALLGIGALFLLPILGIGLPVEIPAIGPEVMGMPAAGLGTLVLGVVLLIAGIKMY